MGRRAAVLARWIVESGRIGRGRRTDVVDIPLGVGGGRVKKMAGVDAAASQRLTALAAVKPLLLSC
jgi:hypothetical protein